MTFIEKMKMQAKQDIKTIVLPESKDIRTLEATEIVLKEGFANIILIGNPQEINELAEKNNINLNGFHEISVVNLRFSTGTRA